MTRDTDAQMWTALWKRLQQLLPAVELSLKGGRPRLDDERALGGILFVLRTGIAWEDLPQELGFGSGMTCWRRLCDWQELGLWKQLHSALLSQMRRAGQLDLSRASIDAASVASPRGAHRQVPTRRTGASSAARGT